MRVLFPDVQSQSCGIAAGDLDDLMVAVMREKGADMSNHEAQTLGDVVDDDFDLIIAFTDAAGEAAKAAFEDKDVKIEVWPLPDPTQGSLDVRAMMNNYRASLDNIEGRLKRAFLK